MKKNLLSILNGNSDYVILQNFTTPSYFQGYSKYLNVAFDDYGFEIMRFVEETFKSEEIGTKPVYSSKLGMRNFQESPRSYTWACSLEYEVPHHQDLSHSHSLPMVVFVEFHPACTLATVKIQNLKYSQMQWSSKPYDLSKEEEFQQCVEYFQHPIALIQEQVDLGHCEKSVLNLFH